MWPFTKLFSWWKSKNTKVEKTCDHVYFPARNLFGELVGQTCAICHQFNSMEDLGLVTRKNEH